MNRSEAEHGPTVRAKKRRKRGPLDTSLQLFFLLLMGLVQVRYLREGLDSGGLAFLVAVSVMFGLTAAQLPFLKKWLDRIW